MIELYVELQTGGQDADDLVDRAERAERSGREGEALKTVLCALLCSHAAPQAYDRAVSLAFDLFLERGRAREAVTLSWYAESHGARRLLERVPNVDRARTLLLFARKDPQAYEQASALFESEGLLARAAICYEQRAAWKEARTLWSRLADQLDRAPGEHYAAGLARFNVSRTSVKLADERTAREAVVHAVHRLEEAATVFESIGQRERAFDCYSVLISIGELSNQFEHVLVGSLDSIRILREDNLRHHVLKAYEEVLDRAERAQEYAAAASLAREYGAYAESQGFAHVIRTAAAREAVNWQLAAIQLETHGAPVGLVENSWLSAIRCHAEFAEHEPIAHLFEKLAKSARDEARKAHFARAFERSKAAPKSERAAPAKTAKKSPAITLPEVWHIDLLEWENKGSAAETCADLLLDPALHVDRITKRAALFGRLVALAAESQAQDRALSFRTLAEHLAPIGVYSMLAPLEKLAADYDASVRSAAVNSLSRYFFKRTFVTLETALSDVSDEVRSAAIFAVAKLRFDHAFEPLSRIYRSTPNERARLTALATIARLEIPEAAELVLSVIEHGSDPEYEAILETLSTAVNRRFLELVRAALPGASPVFAERLRRILKGNSQ